jgi:hypothetical protein
MPNKQDSNLTGLSYAEELTPKVLPGSPVWYLLEPNSYSDMGGQIKTVTRDPINPSRQRKRGTITDLDASGAFNQDLSLNNLTRLLQGFFFADIREKLTTAPMNTAAIPLTSVTTGTNTYNAASGLGTFLAKSLVWSQNFGVTANNGLARVVSRTATTLVVGNALATEASPPATASIRTVGFEFDSGDCSIVMNGALARLTSATISMSTLGLIPGEWIYLGGDAAGTTFNSVNKGYARVSVISGLFIEFDKTSWTPIVDAGAGKTIRIFFGSVLQNEASSLIKRRTYQLERQIGRDDAALMMSELLVGAVPNELTINIPQADKVSVDLSFVALDNEVRTGPQGLKSGARPALVSESAFNTSSDIARIKLGLVDATSSNVTPLFAFATEATLMIKNGVAPNKAVGVLGGFDATAGSFEIGGKLTAYFGDTVGPAAVRANSDATIDIVLKKPNAAVLFDIPMMGLGDGRLGVEKDKPITLPLDMEAGESKFGTSLLFVSFPYLPSVAG